MRFITLLAVVAIPVLAQPVIDNDGVVNNASYLSSGLPNSGVAQGSIFAVFGRGLGPAALVQAQSFPLPTELGGTSVRVTVGSTTVSAIILYAIAGQVGAILPSNTPLGDGTLTVTFNSQTSAPARIRVVRSAFGIFTINQAGSGPAVLTDTNFRVNLVTEVFRPNDVVILWGTGLGPVSGNEAGGPLPGDVNVEVEVLVGGQRAELLGKSRSGCCAGLDQIAFRIPRGVEGCYVPVVVRGGGVVSNFASISIASTGRVCSDPNGFSASDLERVSPGGNVSLGFIQLNRTGIKFTAPPPLGTFESRTDSGSGAFLRFNFSQIIGSRGVSGLAPFGQCLVTVFRGLQPSGQDPVSPTPLDAGPALNLNGPKGAKQLQKIAGGTYSATLGGGAVPGVPGSGQPDYLDPGTYTIDNGAGGADVGAFRATLNVPQLLNWTNQDSITNVSRSQGLLITWTGGDPAREYVLITGASSRTNPAVGASFVCSERASAGRFTVPAEVLSVLPVSEQQSGVPTGFLSVGGSPLLEPNKFTAQGLDFGYFSYGSFSGKLVAYQ